MGFTTNGLTANGKTKHFQVSYDDAFVKQFGIDTANQFMAGIENDFLQLQKWFGGIELVFDYPLSVQLSIVGADGIAGAGWQNPADIVRIFYNPTILIQPDLNMTAADLRYLLVSELAEMFMVSQGKGWGNDGQGLVTPSDEGSKGEGLSRFLGAEWKILNGMGPVPPAHFDVTKDWLNSTREDFVHNNPDDTNPDKVTGCITLFLYFLKDQLGFDITSIIAAGSDTLANVYKKLTGKDDSFDAFSKLLNSHYPIGLTCDNKGDSVFPVPDLVNFVSPNQVSWVGNTASGVAYAPTADLFINHPALTTIHLDLASDVPGLVHIGDIKNNDTIAIDLSKKSFPIKITPQPSSFVKKIVTLSATYAGLTLNTRFEVVAPSGLTLPPLQIKPASTKDDSCTCWYQENHSETFSITNLDVIKDRRHLTYQWNITGATATQTNQPTLTLNIPVARTRVTITVTVKNDLGIQATGKLSFTTVNQIDGIRATMACRIHKTISTIKQLVPVPDPGDPVAKVVWKLDTVSLQSLEANASQLAESARSLNKAVVAGKI